MILQYIYIYFYDWHQCNFFKMSVKKILIIKEFNMIYMINPIIDISS